MDKLLANVDWNQMLEATGETLYMTAIAALATFVLGLILGLLLFMTAKDNLWENKSINTVIGAFVNIFRSIPFIILIILLIPFTKILLGTILGASAALPALIIGAAPFYARMVEIALREIDKGVIEASKAMGAKNKHNYFESVNSRIVTSISIWYYGYDNCFSRIYSNGGSCWCWWPWNTCLLRRIPKRK